MRQQLRIDTKCRAIVDADETSSHPPTSSHFIPLPLQGAAKKLVEQVVQLAFKVAAWMPGSGFWEGPEGIGFPKLEPFILSN